MAADAALDQAPGVLGVSYRVQGAADFPVRVDLPGLFSVSNSLAAIAVCAQMGIPEKAMQEHFPQSASVGGVRQFRCIRK